MIEIGKLITHCRTCNKDFTCNKRCASGTCNICTKCYAMIIIERRMAESSLLIQGIKEIDDFCGTGEFKSINEIIKFIIANLL